MAQFYVWETVDFPLQLKREDETTGILEDCKDVIVSFEQQGILLEKDIESPDIELDVENDIINVHLTQEDTGQFKPDRDVTVQVNILYEDTERDATAHGTIKALRNLHKAVMT